MDTPGEQPTFTPPHPPDSGAQRFPGQTPAPPTGGIAGSSPHGTGGLPMIPSVTTQDLLADSLIANAGFMDLDGRRYRALGGIPLIARLGQGGMGAVYYGIHLRLKKEVAVKVLPFHLAQRNPEFISRFYREAQIAANIQSPNLVNVLDVNQENGLFFLVMDYVNGMTAGGYLKELRALDQPGYSEAAALDVCIAATRGLAAAHAEGVIHRDIKPDNILIPKKRGGSELNFAGAKLNDLGLAHAEGLEKSVTESGACMGTPGYMSPEQAMDAKTCGQPSDVFSLGATLYALLSGSSPFRATGSDSALMRVLLDTRDKPHVPIRRLRPQISELTAAVMDKCLAKGPHARYPSAAALLRALETARDGLNQTENTIPGAPQFKSPAPVSKPAVPSQPQNSSPSVQSRPQVVAGIARATPNVATRQTASNPAAQAAHKVQPANSAFGKLWFCGLSAFFLFAIFSLACLVLYSYLTTPDEIVPNPNNDVTATLTVAEPPPIEAPSITENDPAIAPLTPAPERQKLRPMSELLKEGQARIDAREAEAQKAAEIKALAELDDLKIKIDKLKAETEQKTMDDAVARINQVIVEEAQRDVAAGKLEEAEAKFKQILRDSPDNQSAKSGLESLQKKLVLNGHLKSLAAAEDLWKKREVFNAQVLLKTLLEAKPTNLNDPQVEKAYARGANILGDLYTEESECEFNDVEAVRWYRLAADAGDPLGMSNLGFMYYTGDGTDKDMTKSESFVAKSLTMGLEKVANAGDPRAQFNMGTIYEVGLGTKQDLDKAFSWYKKSSDLGYAKAQTALGTMYLTGAGAPLERETGTRLLQKSADQGNAKAQLWAAQTQRVVFPPKNDAQMAEMIAKEKVWNAKALEFYQKAANQGNASAQTMMGHLHNAGTVVEKNEATTAEWYRKAAKKGYADAQLRLGYMHQKGVGMPVNFNEAARLYNEAAAQGLSEAQDLAGMMYMNGWGGAKDYVKARELFEKASAQGWLLADFHLGMLYEFGHSVEKNANEAKRLYLKAAEGDCPEAQLIVGNMYSYGNWVPRDYAAAKKWYELAAGQGNLDAEFNIARFEAQGLGMPRNQEAAFTRFKSNAEKGHAQSMFMLSLKYTNGSGVKRNDSQAVIWYRKSREAFAKLSNQGDVGAQAFNLLFSMIDLAGLNLGQNLNPLLTTIREAARNGDANCADVMRTLGE